MNPLSLPSPSLLNMNSAIITCCSKQGCRGRLTDGSFTRTEANFGGPQMENLLKLRFIFVGKWGYLRGARPSSLRPWFKSKWQNNTLRISLYCLIAFFEDDIDKMFIGLFNWNQTLANYLIWSWEILLFYLFLVISFVLLDFYYRRES